MEHNTPQVIIRNATTKDAEILAELILQLGYTIKQEEILQRIQTYLTKKDYRIYVATINNTVIGMISLIFCDYLHRTDRFATVSALIIEEQHRQTGIGKKLLAFVEQEAKLNECISIELKSSLQRIKDGTHEFYKRQGYIDNAVNQTYFKKILT